jgi:hypothetical protein
MGLLPGRDGKKYPEVHRRGFYAGRNIPWMGNGRRSRRSWDAVVLDANGRRAHILLKSPGFSVLRRQDKGSARASTRTGRSAHEAVSRAAPPICPGNQPDRSHLSQDWPATMRRGPGTV